MIEFLCPVCDAVGRVSKNMAGEDHKCQGCATTLTVPGIEATPGFASVKNDRAHANTTAATAINNDNIDHVPCSRCGNFMAQSRSKRNYDGLCDICSAKLDHDNFPFDRDNWNIGGAFRFARDRFNRDRNWQTCVGAYALLLFVRYAIKLAKRTVLPIILKSSPSLVPTVTIGFSLLSVFITGLLGLGLVTILVNCLLGRPLKATDLFAHLHRAPGYILVAIIMIIALTCSISGPMFIAGFAGSITGDERLGLILAVLIGLPSFGHVLAVLLLANAEFAHNSECGPIQAFMNAQTLLQGQYYSVILAVIVCAFIAVCGLFLCGIGLLLSIPLAMLVFLTVYLALRNNSELPPAKTTRLETTT